MEYVHLTGTEAVTNASHRMAEASNNMRAAIDQMQFLVQRLETALSDHASRIEAVVASEAERG